MLSLKCCSGFVSSQYQSQTGVEVQMLALKLINKGTALHRLHTLASTKLLQTSASNVWSEQSQNRGLSQHFGFWTDKG